MSRRPKTHSRPGYRSTEDKRRALSRLAALEYLLHGLKSDYRDGV
jgi:hypothetical protein